MLFQILGNMMGESIDGVEGVNGGENSLLGAYGMVI